MKDKLWKIIEVCVSIAVILCLTALNFWAFMETYGKILILCSIVKALFCVSCLLASICIICLVIIALFFNED